MFLRRRRKRATCRIQNLSLAMSHQLACHRWLNALREELAPLPRYTAVTALAAIPNPEISHHSKCIQKEKEVSLNIFPITLVPVEEAEIPDSLIATKDTK